MNMELTEQELLEVNALFKKINTLFYYKTKAHAKNYQEVFFYKENDFRYFKIKYKDIEFEIYYMDGKFNYEQGTSALFLNEILLTIQFIKENCLTLFNKPVERDKMINYTFEAGDRDQIMLNRCRKKNSTL